MEDAYGFSCIALVLISDRKPKIPNFGDCLRSDTFENILWHLTNISAKCVAPKIPNFRDCLRSDTFGRYVGQMPKDIFARSRHRCRPAPNTYSEMRLQIGRAHV